MPYKKVNGKWQNVDEDVGVPAHLEMKGVFVDPISKLAPGTLTSSVWTEPFQMPKDFGKNMWATPHECIRHEMLRLKAVLKVFKPSPESFAKFSDYFEKYVAILLKFHHSAEDNVFFPAAAVKVEIPKHIAEEHGPLDNEIVNKVRDALKAKSVSDLNAAIDGMDSYVNEHMSGEERELIPLVETAYDISWMGATMAKFGPWGQTSEFKDVIPLMMKMCFDAAKVWGGDAGMKKNLPPPVAALIDDGWNAAFAEPKAKLLQEVATG